MDNETGAQTQSVHSLIPLADFKALLGVDDREEKTAVFCLITATYTIEQYCKRRLFRKKHADYLTYTGERIFTLREYPVRRVLAVYAADREAVKRAEALLGPESLVPPEQYYCLPDEQTFEDLPFSLALRPTVPLCRLDKGIKVRYVAGYAPGQVPPDLASACLELAAWNMARYRGRRIGITGNVRGAGKDGEHLEPAMPENVRLLLEPYQRRVI
jgi:uncharacterized phiE125 gp8 family phage protein